MLEGDYEVTLKSPLGIKRGSVFASTDGGAIKGTINILNDTNHFTGKVFNGGRFEASGELKTPTGQMVYEVEGTTNGNEFEGFMNTAKGLMELKGRRAGKE